MNPHRYIVNSTSHHLLGVMLMAALLIASLSQLIGAEIARRADDFVNSIGTNTHLGGNQYYNASTFGNLGIRHFRDNVAPDTSGQGFQRLQSLYNTYGIRGLMVCDSTSYSIQQRQAVMESAVFESIEGLNEPDLFGPRSYLSYTDDLDDQNYVATIAFQNDLYNAMKADPLTSGKPVLSAAMGHAGLTRALRGSMFDMASVHWYEGGGWPVSHSLDGTVLPSAQLISVPGGLVPKTVVTETGWQSPGSGWQIVSDQAAAKYIPRGLVDYYKRNVQRTYLFEMSDTPGVYNYGIIRADGSVKPAYTAVKNLIAILKEGIWNQGSSSWQIPTFVPGELDYTLGGETANLHHLLLQKSNGDFYLLLWQELKSFNTTTGQDIANPDATVNLAFNTPIISATTYELNSHSAVAVYTGNPKTLSLAVGDEILIVKLTPDPNPAWLPDPRVVLYAHDPEASQINTSDTGLFTVYRSGSTASPLTVNYQIDGTAQNGTDYAALSGSVVIPSGASGAGITVSPQGLTDTYGNRTVIATLKSGLYNLGVYHLTGAVEIDMESDDLDMFDGASLINWTSENHSSLSVSNSNVDEGSGALKWTFESTGDLWGNKIVLHFPTPVDWSSVPGLSFRLAEAATNSPDNAGQSIFFDIANNNSSASEGASVASFQLGGESMYRTIELPFGSFARDQVTSIGFYVYGSAFTQGEHTWYLDSLRLLEKTCSLLADFENVSLADWSTDPHSSLAINSASPNSGARDLKWTYQDNGIDRWGNGIRLNFPSSLDLTKKQTVLFRFAIDSSNPSSDTGKPVYFDIRNDGHSTSGGASVAHWTISGASGFATIELDLGDFARDKVTAFSFYVDGNSFSTGDHVWRLDDLTVY